MNDMCVTRARVKSRGECRSQLLASCYFVKHGRFFALLGQFLESAGILASMGSYNPRSPNAFEESGEDVLEMVGLALERHPQVDTISSYSTYMDAPGER